MFWGKEKKEKQEEDKKEEEVIANRRRYFRLEKHLPVKVFDTQKRQFAFIAKDISGGGLKLTGAGGFPPGTYLSINFQLDTSLKPVTAMARVIWVKKGDDIGSYDLGLEYVDIKEPDRDLIVKHINDELLRLRRKGAI